MANFQNKLTPERREEILSAMESANGKKKDAAKILNTTTTTLLKHIRRDEVLSAKYDPLYKPDVVDSSVHRPVDRDQVAAISLAKEEASLVGGWQEVGFSEEEAEYLSGLSKFTNGKLDQVIDFTYGGMIRNTTSLSLLVEKIMKRLDKLMADPTKYHEINSEGAITYSGYRKIKETNSSLLEVMKEMRATNAAAEQTMITRAKIDEIKRVKDENKKTGFRKPGFGPAEVFGAGPKMTQHVTNNNGVKDATEV
jgi:hypothetical protein